MLYFHKTDVCVQLFKVMFITMLYIYIYIYNLRILVVSIYIYIYIHTNNISCVLLCCSPSCFGACVSRETQVMEFRRSISHVCSFVRYQIWAQGRVDREMKVMLWHQWSSVSGGCQHRVSAMGPTSIRKPYLRNHAFLGL